MAKISPSLAYWLAKKRKQRQAAQAAAQQQG